MQAPLREQLHSQDPDAILQAVELLRSLDNPQLISSVIASLSLPPAWDKRVRLLLAGHFPDLCPLGRIVSLSEDDLHHLWCLSGPHTRLFRLNLSRGRRLTDLSRLPRLRGLVSLRLSHLSIQDLGTLPPLPGLRSLYIAHLPRLRALDLSAVAPSLENLTVRGCRRLLAIDPLPASLRTLRIRSCPQLVSVPGLSAAPLRVLELDCVHSDALSPPLVLPSVRRLAVRNTKRVDLSGLAGSPQRLDLHQTVVSGLQSVSCEGLRALRLHDVTLFDESLPDLSAVGRVEISGGAPLLKRLDGLPPEGLEKLELRDCRSLQDISGLRGVRLRQLRLLRARKLKDLSPVQGIRGLRRLSVSAIFGKAPASLQTMGIFRMPQLKELQLHQCGRLGTVRGLETLPGLERLGLTQCRHLRDFQGLETLRWLRELDLRGSSWAGPDAVVATGPAARRLAQAIANRSTGLKSEIHRFWLHSNTSSAKWRLAGCTRMSITASFCLPSLNRARKLEELTLRSVRGADLNRMGPKPLLHILRLHSVYPADLSLLPSIAPALRELVLRSCSPSNTSVLARCLALSSLHLIHCRRPPTVIARMPQLRTLLVSSDFPMRDIARPPRLERLVLWQPSGGVFQALPQWAPQLQSLTIQSSGRSTDVLALDRLAPLAELRELVLERTRVRDVQVLRHGLPNLERVDLRGSGMPPRLRRVWVGADVAALRKLL